MQFFFDNIILITAAFLSGGLLLWPLVAKGSSAATLNTLGATQLLNTQDAILIDLREPAETAKGTPPQALHIPLSALESRIDDIKQRVSKGKQQAPVICAKAAGAA